MNRSKSELERMDWRKDPKGQLGRIGTRIGIGDEGSRSRWENWDGNLRQWTKAGRRGDKGRD